MADPSRSAYWIAARWTTRATFGPNREVDEISWVAPREARKLLTYEHDRRLLESFEDLVARQGAPTRTLVVLRHAKAVSRDASTGDDLDRPLAAVGHDRAKELAPLLSAFGVRRVVSSPATRTVQTVEPYVAATDELLELDDRLLEDTLGSEGRAGRRGAAGPQATRRGVHPPADPAATSSPRSAPTVPCSPRASASWSTTARARSWPSELV